MSLSDIRAEHVLKAIEEFDELGREEFLERYGFKKARDYFLVHDGQRYDSKAIVGVAYGYAHPEAGPLAWDDFSGGQATVGSLLEDLGLEVATPDADESWLESAADAHLAEPLKTCTLRFLRGELEDDRFPSGIASYLQETAESDEEAALAVAVYVLRRIEGLAWYRIGAAVGIGSLDEDHESSLASPARRLYLKAIGRPEAPETAATQDAEWQVRGKTIDDISCARNVWIFQGNPKRWDFDGWLDSAQAADVVNWTVAQHKNEVQPGDKVLLWKAGDEAGIYAICRVVSEVYEVEEPDEFGDTKVDIEVERLLEGPLLREELKDHPVLRNLQIIQMPRGTNYPVNNQEWAALKELLEEGGGVDDPVHILTRWRADTEPRTIEIHQGLTTREGSVWWGHFGNPDATAMSDAWIERYREQLDSGEDTYVFIYRKGDEEWRTRLLEITDDASEVDTELLPDYYTAEQCNLFLRITDFTRLPDGWVEANLALHSRPDGDISRSLAGRADLMYVIERAATEVRTASDVPERYFVVNQKESGGPDDLTVEGKGYAFSDKVDVAANLLDAGGGYMVWYHTGSYPDDTKLHFVGWGPVEEIEELGVMETNPNHGERPHWRANYETYRRFPRPVPRSEFEPRPNYQHSINEITEEDFDELLRRAGVTAPLGPREVSVQDLKSIAESEPRNLQLPDDLYASLVAALTSGKHVLLTGPPGTGKTTLAEAAAMAAERAGLCSGYTLTTATADWTTFETLGGLRPSEENELKFSYGQFLSAIRDNRWLVIDELNRANFDRAFGQFFTVLSGQTVELPYTDPESDKPIALVPEGASLPRSETFEVVRVPKSWRIVATMNVFDKSLLFEMSYALMRRFAFIEVGAPSDTTYRRLIEDQLSEASSPIANKVKSVVGSLMALRPLKELGPAIFIDMARFGRHRLELGDINDDELTYQLFYSYVLPQFEGITDLEGRQLFDVVKPLMGSRAPKVKRDLVDVLGLEGLREVPDTSSEDDDFEDEWEGVEEEG